MCVCVCVCVCVTLIFGITGEAINELGRVNHSLHCMCVLRVCHAFGVVKMVRSQNGIRVWLYVATTGNELTSNHKLPILIKDIQSTVGRVTITGSCQKNLQ